MSLFSAINDMIGSALNDITGATNSSKRQFANQLNLQKDAQNFAKWQMMNAHQTEVQDLQNAGLNPVLSANGGASAGVTEGSASAGNAAADPISMINTIVSMINNTKQVKAMVDKTEAETDQINQTIEWTPSLNASLIKLQTAQSNKAQAEAQKALAETAAQEFINKMREMDVKKRSAEWDKELDIYKQQMSHQLVQAGVSNSTANYIIEQIGKGINAISPLTTFVPSGGNTYNVNSPTVNY